MALLVHIISASKLIRNLLSRLRGATVEDMSPDSAHNAQPNVSLWEKMKRRVASLGGGIIFAYMIARLIGSLALVGLSVASLALEEMNEKENTPSVARWLHVAMCTTFVSCSICLEVRY